MIILSFIQLLGSRGADMALYCSFGDLQSELTSYYHKTGSRLQFHEAVERLYKKGKLSASRPDRNYSVGLGHAEISAFQEFIDHIWFPVNVDDSMNERVSEQDMIPQLNDVFVIRHPRHTRPYMHRHDYVEIDYLVEGSCTLYFEEEVLTLTEGELCLISPTSYHDIEIKDESTVCTLMLRRSTFQSSFFSLLDRDDVLSTFFRNTLTDMLTPNYMIFRAGDTHFTRIMLQSALQECHYPDQYSNNCCIGLVNLLFANLLRSSDEAPKVYHNQVGSDFSRLLHYIRKNYRTITLTALAAEFHYSKPHLCTIIKKNTGISFSELIRQVRIKEACEYLLRTDLPISDIAYIVGYNSADNFSRVFRKTHGTSPNEYRRQNSVAVSHFMPLEDY